MAWLPYKKQKSNECIARSIRNPTYLRKTLNERERFVFDKQKGTFTRIQIVETMQKILSNMRITSAKNDYAETLKKIIIMSVIIRVPVKFIINAELHFIVRSDQNLKADYLLICIMYKVCNIFHLQMSACNQPSLLGNKINAAGQS